MAVEAAQVDAEGQDGSFMYKVLDLFLIVRLL